MKRWLVALILAHVAGSYGVEAMDMVANYGMDVPLVARAASPLSSLPFLLRETFGRHQPYLREMATWWAAYLVPAAVVLLTVPRFLRTTPPRWGAAALATGVAVMSNALCLPLGVLLIPVGAIVTLFVLMLVTGRVDWGKVFSKAPASSPV